MGSGLSMTSVNKIKELASAREYSLALEIIDSQDLSRSLNPQFLRLCGDIYTINGRYEDARRTLIMAHRLAPEAKRVLYSFVDLYLRTGYRDLAKFYYDVYMSDADENSYETKHINYIYQKATNCVLSDIELFISPMYIDDLDYDWSYELILLLKLQDKEEECKSLAEDYLATFKNSKNANIISDVLSGTQKAEDLFYIYAKDEIADDDPDLEQLRQEERILMEADDMRVNPREAEIQIVFDDDEVIFGSKRKYRRHLKAQEKLARKAQQEQDVADEEVSEGEGNSSEVVNESEAEEVQAECNSENTDDALQEEQNVENDSEDLIEDLQESKPIKLFKKLFSKRNKKEDDVEVDVIAEIEEADEEEADEKETDEEDAGMVETDKNETNIEETDNESEQEETVEQVVDEDIDVSDMREIYSNNDKKISVVSDIEDVDFTAEFEGSNPFDELSSVEEDRKKEEEKSEIKLDFVFEDAQLQPEQDDEEYEVDDFTSVSQDEYDFDTDGDVLVEESDVEECEEVVAEETVEEYEEVVAEEAVEEYEEAVAEETVEEYEEAVAEETAEEYEEAVAEETVEEYEEAVDTEEVLEDLSTEEKGVIDLEKDRDTIFANVKKNTMDFPVFKTNLFPEYNKDIVEVENNFNEIMNQAQDKINENLIKEEQMQREAEALLASLGISLDDVKPSPNIKPASATGVTQTVVSVPTEKAVEEPKVEEHINQFRPSRDELKSSLKIDSVKKDILKRLKEYR